MNNNNNPPQPSYELIKDITGNASTSNKPIIINAYGFQIEMPFSPNKNCKKCFGRGYIGQNKKTKGIIICESCYSKQKLNKLNKK